MKTIHTWIVCLLSKIYLIFLYIFIHSLDTSFSFLLMFLSSFCICITLYICFYMYILHSRFHLATIKDTYALYTGLLLSFWIDAAQSWKKKIKKVRQFFGPSCRLTRVLDNYEGTYLIWQSFLWWHFSLTVYLDSSRRLLPRSVGRHLWLHSASGTQRRNQDRSRFDLRWLSGSVLEGEGIPTWSKSIHSALFLN